MCYRWGKLGKVHIPSLCAISYSCMCISNDLSKNFYIFEKYLSKSYMFVMYSVMGATT